MKPQLILPIDHFPCIGFIEAISQQSKGHIYMASVKATFVRQKSHITQDEQNDLTDFGPYATFIFQSR
jgi:hypothetical protein